MKKSLMFILIATFFYTSCKMSEVILPTDSRPTAYDVKGKGRIQWKKKISFGNYVAKEKKKTFAKKNSSTLSIGDINLYEEYNERHTFQYEITNIKNNSIYEVSVTHNVNQTNFSQGRDFIQMIKDLAIEDEFSVDSEADLNPKDYLIGAIKKVDGTGSYRFGVSDASRYSQKEALGYLMFDNRKITISEVEEVSKDGMLPDVINLVFGLNFHEGDKYLGTVRTYGGGKVWIENDIPNELKDLVATLSAMMLMKKTE